MSRRTDDLIGVAVGSAALLGGAWWLSRESQPSPPSTSPPPAAPPSTTLPPPPAVPPVSLPPPPGAAMERIRASITKDRRSPAERAGRYRAQAAKSRATAATNRSRGNEAAAIRQERGAMVNDKLADLAESGVVGAVVVEVPTLASLGLLDVLDLAAVERRRDALRAEGVIPPPLASSPAGPQAHDGKWWDGWSWVDLPGARLPPLPLPTSTDAASGTGHGLAFIVERLLPNDPGGAFLDVTQRTTEGALGFFSELFRVPNETESMWQDKLQGVRTGVDVAAGQVRETWKQLKWWD